LITFPAVATGAGVLIAKAAVAGAKDSAALKAQVVRTIPFEHVAVGGPASGALDRRASSFLALGAEPDSIRMFRHPARHELKHGLQLTLFQRHVIL
jgi:hypothetical protein